MTKLSNKMSKCSTQVASWHYQQMLDHAGDQRSSLFCLFVDDEGKKFVTLVICFDGRALNEAFINN